MIVLNVIQRSQEWHEARRGIPTCSRFDSVLTPKTGKPSAAQDTLINQLIAESLTPPEVGFIRAYVSDEMIQGMEQEGEARGAYALEHATGPVTEAGFILHDSGLFGGSPDALVGEDGGCEIKCPSAATHVGYIRGGILPWEYRMQVEGYLLTTGRDWWDFFSYARGFRAFCIRTHRSSFTDALGEELAAFGRKYDEARAIFGLPPIGKTSR